MHRSALYQIPTPTSFHLPEFREIILNKSLSALRRFPLFQRLQAHQLRKTVRCVLFSQHGVFLKSGLSCLLDALQLHMTAGMSGLS